MDFLYRGNSMRRVFRPGDRLRTAAIPLRDFRRGDIAVFFPKGPDEPGIVHRVIGFESDALVTMGDNNAAPDRRRVTADEQPEKVVAGTRWEGAAFAVRNGRAGMVQFRINRVRRAARSMAGRLRRRLFPAPSAGEEAVFRHASPLRELWATPFRRFAFWVVLLEGAAVLAGCVSPLFQRTLIDAVNAGRRHLAATAVGAIGGLLVLEFAARSVAAWIRSQLAVECRTQLKSAMFRRLLTLPESFLRGRGSGYFFNRLQADLAEVSAFLSGAGLALWPQLLRVAVTLAMLAWIDFRCVLWALPFLGWQWLIVRRYRRRQYRLSHRLQECVAAERHVMQEYLAAHTVFKSHAASAAAQRRIDRGFGRWRQLMGRRIRNERSFQVWLQLPVWFGCGSLALYGVHQVLEHVWTLGGVWALLRLLMMAFAPVRAIGGDFFRMQSSLAAWERLRDLYRHQAEPDAGGEAPVRLGGDVAVCDLTFGYEPGKPVLQKISFTVPERSLCFLLGENGSGKSTLLMLLLRLYEPWSGSVTIGGAPIEGFPLAGYRARIGYLGQSPEFFPGTLRENLLLGGSADDAAILEALRVLKSENVVLRRPGGLDAPVSGRGDNLSGGEKLRLALARELLRDTDLLLLDEPAASLDCEARQHFYALLPALCGRRTVIAIVHDPPEGLAFPVYRLPPRG